MHDPKSGKQSKGKGMGVGAIAQPGLGEWDGNIVRGGKCFKTRAGAIRNRTESPQGRSTANMKTGGAGTQMDSKDPEPG